MEVTDDLAVFLLFHRVTSELYMRQKSGVMNLITFCNRVHQTKGLVMSGSNQLHQSYTFDRDQM